MAKKKAQAAPPPKPKRRPYRQVAPRLDQDLVRRTLMTARKIATVDEITEILQIARPTYYAYESMSRAPMGKSQPRFLTLCKKLKLKKLAAEWLY